MVPAADARSLPAADNVTGTDRPHVLETYVPVRRAGQVGGVAEVYRDIGHVLAAVRRMQLIVLAAISTEACLLFLGLSRTYRQSTATIRRQAGELRSVLDAVSAAAGLVRMDVRDTGISLSPEEQAQVFIRFYRAKNRRHRRPAAPGWGWRSRGRCDQFVRDNRLLVWRHLAVATRHSPPQISLALQTHH